ncbi:hypothetical protein SOJ19_04765 [Treponema pallidum]|nr:hypothetical protein SOJ19_04765 [Treponema pallidum]
MFCIATLVQRLCLCLIEKEQGNTAAVLHVFHHCLVNRMFFSGQRLQGMEDLFGGCYVPGNRFCFFPEHSVQPLGEVGVERAVFPTYQISTCLCIPYHTGEY